MLAPIALILGIVTLTAIALNPRNGIPLLIIATPIIDTAWQNAGVFGLRPTELMGVGVPAIMLMRIAFSSDPRPGKFPMKGLWATYLLVSFLGSLIMMVENSLVNGVSLMFRVLYGFVGFYAFQTYFNDREGFKKLLVAYLIGGIFPMLMGLYSGLTGDALREGLYDEVVGTRGQARIAGLYHNAETLRVNAYMTLSAVILYYSYFSQTFKKKFLFLLPYASICVFVLYKIYSKATFASMIIGLFIWTIPRKKFGSLLGIIAVIFVINIATDNLLIGEVAVTYTNEIEAIEGTGSIDRIGSSRFGGFKQVLIQWHESDETLKKLFGWGRWGRHNDFIRALLTTGLVGFIVYVIFLSTIGAKIFSRFRSRPEPLTAMALIIFCSWIIDALGKSPSTYTGYQLWALGFIGLALRGVTQNTNSDDDDKKQEPIKFTNILGQDHNANK